MKEKLQKVDKKTWIMVVGFLVLIMVILFGGAFLYNKMFYKKSYQEVENIMLEAAKAHYMEHPKLLPKSINATIKITDDELVDEKEMQPISEYLKNSEISCSGYVSVTNINGKDYRYAPYLDCGEDNHKTVKFMDYIKNNIETVTTGNGLYNLNNDLVYRGDKVDNYLSFSDKIYRIVKFSDDRTVIIYTGKYQSVVWDDRYNIDRETSSGINDYSISRMRDTLNELYNGNEFISNNDKTLVTAYDLEIGKRKNGDTDKTGSLEKSVIIEEQYIGLLPLYDYLNASTDKNCIESTSPSCINYNYLSKYKYNWWTTTAYSENSHRIYRVNGSSTASLATASSNSYIRPVLYLSSDAIYVSGDGTRENPYIVK